MHQEQPPTAVRIQDGKRSVTIDSVRDMYDGGYPFVSFRVALRDVGLEAVAVVTSYESELGLVRFVADLAADWRGAAGEVTWEAIEHELRIRELKPPPIPGRFTCAVHDCACVAGTGACTQVGGGRWPVV